MQDRQFRDMSRADRQALAMLGAAIRIGRRRMGMSQDALANAADVSQTAVSRLERGMVWGMAVARYARVVWALQERMPLGGCPHPHRCSYSAAWERALDGVRDRVAIELGLDDLADQDPSEVQTGTELLPPASWPGWGARHSPGEPGRTDTF